MTTPSERRKILIIGSGPAGYTAAIYTARANLAPMLIQGLQPGGQLTITTDVENYPGFPEGIMGPEMMEFFRRQAERFGTEILHGVVTGVDLSRSPFAVEIDEERTVHCEALIISTGASAKHLGLPSEQRLLGSGVSMCATCDGFFFRDREIFVVGGGDTALEEASFLTRFGSAVHLVHRRDALRGSKVMQDRVLTHEKIKIHWDSVVEEILGDDTVTGIRLRHVKTDEIVEHPCAAVFVAIGHKPNTELFEGQLEMNETGYIITRPGSTYTSREGVFACGDAQDWTYRQAVTAAGTGCMAAIDAERWLEAQEK